jgi:SAM-dependent methyltransferase
MNPEWPAKIKNLLIPGSVLDLGCGSGRFYPVFEDRDYTGLDKDPNFAKTLRERHPKGRWIKTDITTWKPDKHYDNIFGWVSIQHIPPEKIERVFQMIKSTGKNVIFCERATGPDPSASGYLWKHDYQQHFPGLVMVEQIVTDVWLMNWRNNDPIYKTNH